MERISTALKVLGHSERLRILALLSYGELTISELVKIMGLSQPRTTQYINSLQDAGIVERLKEGSWVFSRLSRRDPKIFALVSDILASLPSSDALLTADRRRLEEVRSERAKASDAFFDNVANDFGRLGDEYLPRRDIDERMKAVLGDQPFEYMIDLGTGTGRMLELLSNRVARGAGVDNNAEMLKVARHKLSDSGHRHLTVRLGDVTATPFTASVADLVTIHQVLHYLDDPNEAIREASRLLRPGGKLLIADFTAHKQEEFRVKYAHRRLGFSDADIKGWALANDLKSQATETIKTAPGKPDVRLWVCQKATG